MKHQSNNYRIIKGVKYINYADLVMSDEENSLVVTEAKSLYNKVRKVKHKDGYYHLMVAEKKFKNS